MQCYLCAPDGNPDQASGPGAGQCQHCGSQSHERQVAWLIKEKIRPAEGAKVLEVGPSNSPSTTLFASSRFLGPAKYTAVGVGMFGQTLNPPHRFLEMDVTRLKFSDQAFEVIICNYVLPFIRSDYQAMSQLHRCLKPSGVAFVQADRTLPKSRKSADLSNEKPAKYTEDYRRRWGTEWFYGPDYLERLEAAGFFPCELEGAKVAGPDTAELLGFPASLLLCFKFRDAMEDFLGSL